MGTLSTAQSRLSAGIRTGARTDGRRRFACEREGVVGVVWKGPERSRDDGYGTKRQRHDSEAGPVLLDVLSALVPLGSCGRSPEALLPRPDETSEESAQPSVVGRGCTSSSVVGSWFARVRRPAPAVVDEWVG